MKPVSSMRCPRRIIWTGLWGWAFLSFWLVGASQAQALPNHDFNPNNPGNPYGLINLDPQILPGDYAYCRWGNLMSSSGLDARRTFSFGPLTQGSSDLFVSSSKTTLAVQTWSAGEQLPLSASFPGTAQWSPASARNGGAGEVTLFPDTNATAGSTPPVAASDEWFLFRKLHFSNDLKDEMTGQELAGDCKKVIVLIHGWNSASDPNAYDDWADDKEFHDLVNWLKVVLQGSDWALVLYHWEADADTGPATASGAPINGTEAAEIGHQHGQHLGELLATSALGLQSVHFIAHSAGSWVARSATNYIVKKMESPKVQVTLLDPFIPGELHFSDGTNQSNLTKVRMEEIAGWDPQGTRIACIENYYARDTTPGDDGALGLSLGTQTTFSWRPGSKDANLWVDELQPSYDSHFGPIQFYADTISDIYYNNTSQQSTLGGIPVRANDYGWYRSMFMQEPVMGAIEQQGTTEGQSCTLSVASGSINTRREILREGQATGTFEFRWQKQASDGSWQNLTDSSDSAHLQGSDSKELIFDKLLKEDAGFYRLVVTRGQSGGVALTSESRPFEVAVNSATNTGGAVPVAPSGLQATAVSASQINLAWTDNSANESGFRLERRQGDGSWGQIATPTGNATVFSDYGLSASTTYTYRIRAYNDAGNSDYSATNSVTTLKTLSAGRTLTIQSSNPASGAYIYLSKDLNGQGDIVTPATRTYNANKVVTLVATETVNGNTFVKWLRDGVFFSFEPTVYLTMDTDHAMTAVYASSTVAHVLSGLAIEGGGALNEGTSAAYQATASFSDGTSQAVTPTWTVGQNGSPATISTGGVLSVGAVDNNMLVTIHANYATGGVAKEATKTVTILNVGAGQTYDLGLSYDTTRGYVARTPNQNRFAAGAQVVLRAIPETNYRFTGWGGDSAGFGTTNPITVTMDGSKSITADFTYDNLYFGPVKVTIEPAGAAAAGALWRLGNGSWQSSGATVVPDSNGDAVLFFADVPGYKTPPTRSINIVSGQVNAFTATYVSQLSPGAVQVTIQPTGAVTAGAQWRPVGVAYDWQNSGAKLTLEAGEHEIEFKALPNWTTPVNQKVTVSDGRTIFASAVYGPPAGVPAIYSILPATGPQAGGTVVTIDGANLTPPVAVYFDGVAATSVTPANATQLTAVAPGRASGGTVPVKVVTAGGEATKASGFTYGPALGQGMQLELSIGGNVTAVDALDNRAYISQGANLIVLDVSNPGSPTEIGRLTTPYAMYDIAVYRAADSHIYAVLAASDGGLMIVDATNPYAMVLVGSMADLGEVRDIALLGGFAYLAAGDSGLEIIDLANPAKPVLRGSMTGLSYAASVAVEARADALIAYVAGASDRKVHIIDVSNPDAPIHKSAFSHGAAWISGNYGMAVKNGMLYLGLGSFSPEMEVIDVTDIANPTLVTKIAAGGPMAIFIRNNTLYAANEKNQVLVYDLSNVAAPRSLGSLTLLNVTPQRAALLGNCLYLAGGESGLTIVDVGNPTGPYLKANYSQGAHSARSVLASSTQSTIYSGGYNRDVDIYASNADNLYSTKYLTSFMTSDGLRAGLLKHGNLLFFTDGKNGITILDVTNPDSPVVRGRLTSIITYGNMAMHGNRLVVVGQDASDYHAGLWVVDVSNPAAPAILGQANASSLNWGLAVNGNTATAVSNSDGGLHVFDLSDERNPRETGALATPGYATSVAISSDGQTAYVGGHPTGSGDNGGVLVVDISDPHAPAIVTRIMGGEFVNDVMVSGNRLVVSDSSDGVTVLDIANPRSPAEIAHYNTPGFAWQSWMEGDQIYLADGSAGVAVLTLMDVAAPTVSITNPTFASAYTAASGLLVLGGAAADDKSLARIVWANDRGGSGVVAGLDSWTTSGVQLYPGQNVITVSAYDAAGNRGTDTLTVTYTPTDTTTPAVNIAYPSSADEITTGQQTIELRGTAEDNNVVAGVAWSNDRGGSGAASGSANWTAAGIPLLEGPNKITITATDAAGNQATAVVTVTYAPADAINPIVVITFPTLNTTYATSSDRVNLSGTAADDRGLAKISWATDRGGNGTANGTSVWSVNGIPLQPGWNIVTVTAEDGAGNTSADSLAINYTATLRMVGTPSPQAITTGGTASFNGLAEGAPGVTYQWQESNDGGASWHNLADGGAYAGVTTGTLTITNATVGMTGLQYRVVAASSVGDMPSNPAVLTVTGEVPFRLDLNGDGQTDILWRNRNGEVGVWLMNGTSPTSYHAISTVNSDYVLSGTGDFNGDGQTDILWRYQPTGEVGVWLMNGTTVTGYHAIQAVNSDYVLSGTGDFNGDGQTDILLRHPATGEVGVWLMNGTTVTSYHVISTVNSDYVLSGTGDFNGDGQTDILWRYTPTGEVGVWLMNGITVTSYQAIHSLDRHYEIRGAGDYDGDGQTDILLRYPATGEVGVWLMHGTSVTGYHAIQTVNSDYVLAGNGAPARPAERLDLNGDGQTDILWRNQDTGQAVVWLMQGTALDHYVELPAPSLDYHLSGWGDFNGDGQEDLLWRHIGGEVGVWLMDGTTVKSYQVLGWVNPAYTLVGTGDFNGDGQRDILWRLASGELGVWLMNGANVSGYRVIANVNPAYTLVGTGDFNGDGQTDILWRHTATGEVGLWVMHGLTVDHYESLGTVNPDYVITGTGDYNGDGQEDILWRHTPDGELGLWLMHGTQPASYQHIDTVPTAWQVTQ